MKQRVVDRTNGYERVAEEFMARRLNGDVGASTVRAWSRTLPRAGAVLDLGCGHGVPISQTLIEERFLVYGVDASARMTAEFRKRFPTAPVACESVENSEFFHRTFDGVIAWGLMFLLPANSQQALITRVASVLNAGGRFLFTAPKQECSWADTLTGQLSLSLGSEVYQAVLAGAGLRLVDTYVDEGENHYYDAANRTASDEEDRHWGTRARPTQN